MTGCYYVVVLRLQDHIVSNFSCCINKNVVVVSSSRKLILVLTLLVTQYKCWINYSWIIWNVANVPCWSFFLSSLLQLDYPHWNCLKIYIVIADNETIQFVMEGHLWERDILRNFLHGLRCLSNINSCYVIILKFKRISLNEVILHLCRIGISDNVQCRRDVREGKEVYFLGD